MRISRTADVNLIFGILIPLILTLIGCHSDPISTSRDSQPTLIGGTITSDTTWQAKDGPFHIVEDIFVPDSVNWTVQYGTVISVDWQKKIEILGFARFYGGIEVSSENGVWQGFKISGRNFTEEGATLGMGLGWMQISNAIIATECSDSVNLSIYNCNITNCDSLGIRVKRGATVFIQQCVFTNSPLLNVLNPVAIWATDTSACGVYTSQITGFHIGIKHQIECYYGYIEENIISECDIGVVCDRSPYPTTYIEQNKFRDCQTGILITQGSPLITYNTFEKLGKCIEVKGSCQPEAHYNSFVDTDRWAWVNNSPYDVDATYNWWGTTDPDSINQLIYDHNDDPDYGTVHYEPFLTTAP